MRRFTRGQCFATARSDWRAGFALALTSRVRDYPFEAKLPDSAIFRGVVLADQPRSISWEQRPIKHAGRAPDIVLTEVRERLDALLGTD
jgi:mRNA interferase MazF